MTASKTDNSAGGSSKPRKSRKADSPSTLDVEAARAAMRRLKVRAKRITTKR